MILVLRKNDDQPDFPSNAPTIACGLDEDTREMWVAFLRLAGVPEIP
ncbi:MAG: hypothetical protein N2C14_10525 [Planctomycetales bacterium]